MKKALLVLVIACLAFAVFADDAKVLPARVIRTYLVPSYAFASQEFNADGDKVDMPLEKGGAVSVFNLGAALEVGVTEWMSAALQWAPGYNLTSSFELIDNQSANGAFELFAGAKIQILGDQGLVKNDKFRFAVAPGVMIPMNFGYDVTEELTNAGTGQEYNVDPSNGVFAFGGRVYADYVVNKNFFVNLYGEFIKYTAKAAEDDFVATATNMERALYSLAPYEEVNYGYKLTGEVDFNYDTPISDTLLFSAGLPVVFTYSPQKVYDDAEPVSEAASYVLAINPSASVMVLSLPLPVEFQVSYKLPLMGQNASVMNTLTAQIKAYMRF